MGNQDIYVGLDIGTTSIKVIVAEYVQGQMNVIGVGSERATGLSRGVIVDIDKAVTAIQAAIKQAEEKASIQIHQVVVGIPANMLQIEKVTGMIAVSDQGKEITDADVVAVTQAAMVRNLPPEREVLSITPTEFVVDGFDDIKDPRGMIGVRLELQGIMFTVPKTVLHNTKKAIEKAGLSMRTVIAAPVASAQIALTADEKDFGTVLIDIGGGQSTAAVIHDNMLKFTDTDQEGGEYVTKDISQVLNTGFADAEKLKRDYGNADSLATSDQETFPVTVVGKTAPEMVSEQYLSEIIEARIGQIFKRLLQALAPTKALDLPGGVVLTGGSVAMPGIVELAQDILQRPVKRFVPDEMGLRHPAFTQALGLIYAAASMSEVDQLVQSVISHQPVAAKQTPAPAQAAPESDTQAVDQPDEPKPEKKRNGFSRFISSFFE